MAKNGRRPMVNSRLFWNTFVLYACAVFLPIFVIAIVIHFNYFVVLEKEIDQSNRNYLNTIMNIYDLQFEKLNSLSVNFETNPSITLYQIRTSPMTAIEELKKYATSQDVITDIILYERNKDKFYTTSGTYFFDFLPSYCNFTNWDQVLFREALYTQKPFYKYMETPTRSYIFYITPLPKSFSNPSRTVVFVIDNERMKGLFNMPLETNHEKVLVFDRNYNVVSVFSDVGVQTIHELQKILEQKQAAFSGSIMMDNEKMYFTVMHSVYTGMYYVRFLPEINVMKNLRNTQMILSLVIVALLLAGSIIVYAGIKTNYSPIRKLAMSVTKALNKDANNFEKANELNVINNAFIELTEFKNRMEVISSQSVKAMKDLFLSSMLKGSFETREALNHACSNIGIQFTKNLFQICTFLFEEPLSHQKDEDISSELCTMIESVFKPEIECSVKDVLMNNRLVAVTCLNEQMTAMLMQKIKKVQEMLYEKLDVHITVGVSKANENPDMLGKAYLESLNALDYRLVYGKGSVIFAQDVLQSFHGKEYPAEAIKMFERSLFAFDIEGIKSALNEVIRHIKKQNSTLFICRYICFDIVYIFKKIVNVMDISYIYTIHNSFNLDELEHYATIDELVDTILKFSGIIVDFANNHSSGEQLARKVVKYIEENYCDPNFQINLVAEHFSVSAQYLRSVFKEQTGQTISSFVNKLKMEKAKELLRCTKDTVNEIVQKIGNTDISSFTRKFKQETGMTPGKFRELFSEPKN